MAHRALVAYERPDDTFSVHYSHSGADRYHLATAITAQTPFGGEEPVDQLRELAAVVRDPNTTGRTLPEPNDDQTEWSEFAPPVDLCPQATAISWDTLLNRTDYLAFEAVYVVTVDWRVNTYQTFWFGLGALTDLGSPPTAGHGLLLALDADDAGRPTPDRWLDGFAAGAKGVLGSLLDRELLSPAAATTLYISRLCGAVPEATERHITRAHPDD